MESRFGCLLLCRLATLTLTILSFSFSCSASAPPPVPTLYQDLYNTLNSDLGAFNTTLNSLWHGSKYPVVFAGNLTNADANSGPQLINPGYYNGILLQLQALQAMGAKAVMIQIGFPMLYAPFFSSQTEYQQYVTFYQQVAASVRAAGMKIIVENDVLMSNDVQAGWNTAPFYATLNWTQYQQARAQTAQVIAQTLQPDYLVLLQEPSNEAAQALQPNVNIPADAAAMVSQMITSVQQSGVTGLKMGAGVANWQPQYLQYVQGFVTLPLDFIDLHVYPVNNLSTQNFMTNALTICSTAAAAGKAITISEAWMWKMRDTEWNVLSIDQIRSRNAFSFWAPLDAYFLQLMVNLANYEKMLFMATEGSDYFWVYQDYNLIQTWTPAQILSQETLLAGQANQQAAYTSTGKSYYKDIIASPDTTPPTTPANLAGVSGNPTQTSLTWNPSTDNIGVAGYHLFRDGVEVAATAQTFYQDLGLTGSTVYTYELKAFDLAGNLSPATVQVQVTTKDVTPPTQPGNFIAMSPSCKQVALTWLPSTDDIAVGSYTILRGTSPSSLSQIARVTSTVTAFTDYHLNPSTAYYYGLEAVDTYGNVSTMATATSTTLALPSAPTNVVATALSASQISLKWSASASGMPISKYRVYRGLSASQLTQISAVTTTSFINNGLASGTKYYYAIQALDTGGNLSPMSATVSATTITKPSAPKNLTATPLSTTQIGLTWSASTGGLPIANYYVFEGTSPSSLVRIAILSGTAGSYTARSLTPSTRYYYAVQAIDSGGDTSPMSPTVSAVTLALPSAPTNVTATAVSATKVSVAWTAARSGMPLASYYVYRGNSPSTLTQIKVVGATQTSCTDTTVRASTTYYYAVKAADNGGNVSPMSKVVSVTTPK